MKNIKWENVSILVMIVIAIASLVKHISINGLYLELIEEIIIYYVLTIVIHYGIKNLTNKKTTR